MCKPAITNSVYAHTVILCKFCFVNYKLGCTILETLNCYYGMGKILENLNEWRWIAPNPFHSERITLQAYCNDLPFRCMLCKYFESEIVPDPTFLG